MTGQRGALCEAGAGCSWAPTPARGLELWVWSSVEDWLTAPPSLLPSLCPALGCQVSSWTPAALRLRVKSEYFLVQVRRKGCGTACSEACCGPSAGGRGWAGAQRGLGRLRPEVCRGVGTP